ncbi:phosphatase domain-containing protein [Formosa haliotis]|uniref:phosphatase domain-containing protein n=1 Tax=Formosa haliotis TaxID=1555194 RepID=UPI00082443A8|nr:phosphatase domain-containing protein [Formosa haliotis]
MNKKEKAVVIWHLTCLHLEGKTLIKGTLLERLPQPYNANTRTYQHASHVLQTYLTNPYKNADIWIVTEAETVQVQTDDSGNFQMLSSYTLEKQPAFKISEDGPFLKVAQTYPITFPCSKSPFDVISDIDDTAIHSYSTQFLKRVIKILFYTPSERDVVSGTQQLLQGFNLHGARINYVSKSESNLFYLLAKVFKTHKLPQGAMLLTPYLSLLELLIPKKGLDFKFETIQFLLTHTPHKKYVLIGDDSQKDVVVYTKIIKAFPNRILKVYIRQTQPELQANQKENLDALLATQVPVLYFKQDNFIDVKQELLTLKQ